MHRPVTATVLVVLLGWLGWFGARPVPAAPAPSNYSNIEASIARIRQGWERPGATADPNAPGWNIFFTAILDDLRAYSQAETSAARLTPLNRLYQMSTAMAVVPWEPAQSVREELRAWLRPRVRLAWAERRLDETVRSLPPTNDPAVQANRKRWVEFVDNDLGNAFGRFHAATTVAQRQAGLNGIHQALAKLNQRNAERPWQPSAELETAVNDLFNQPNLDVTADLSIVGPIFDQNLVVSGPIYRKGYWSQVTAGPKTGFGLLPSDDGIAFYNSQALQSTTPITDFQNQIASDDRGQQAAKLYHFTATTIDQAEQTIYAVLRTTGLSLTPASTHNVNAQICSNPQPGKGLVRGVAGLIGMNQNKITDMVYQNALAQFQQRIPQEAQEEAEERIAAELAERNADINRFLIGNNMLAFQDYLISGLSLRSRPTAVYVGGLFQSRAGDKQRGADAPQPASLAVPAAGLTADIHLGSVLTSALDGLYNRDKVKSIENLMIVTHDVPPGTPPAQAATITTNVDFPTYLKAVDEAVKAKNPKVQAIRVRKPAQPPEFAADARGFVVAILHDLQIDAPAPDPSSRAGSIVGANAKVLRLVLPQVEVALSYKIESESPGSHHIRAKVEEFQPSTTSEVQAIRDDETKPTRLNRFSGALIISTLAAKLRSQPINADMNNLKFKGFAVESISPLDPSGWVRVNLVKTSDAPLPVDATPPPITSEAPVVQPVPAISPTADQPTQPEAAQAALAVTPG